MHRGAWVVKDGVKIAAVVDRQGNIEEVPCPEGCEWTVNSSNKRVAVAKKKAAETNEPKPRRRRAAAEE